jgi:hypothetical protein
MGFSNIIFFSFKLFLLNLEDASFQINQGVFHVLILTEEFAVDLGSFLLG